MTTMISWLCDCIAMTGALLLLFGIYLACGVAVTLMVSGLLLLSYAARLAWMMKHGTPHDPR